MSLTDDIKDYALDLGYSRAGITGAAGFPDYAAELTGEIRDVQLVHRQPPPAHRGGEPKKHHALGKIDHIAGL